MSKSKRRFIVRLTEAEWERMELIRDVHNLKTLAAVFRVALGLLSRQSGLEKIT